MVCAVVSGPKNYAIFRHFQHETPDSPTHASMHLHICVIFHMSIVLFELYGHGVKNRRQQLNSNQETENVELEKTKKALTSIIGN